MSKYNDIPTRDRTLSIHLQPNEKAMYGHSRPPWCADIIFWQTFVKSWIQSNS